MTKKNPIKKIFENMSIESARTNIEPTESDQAGPHGEAIPDNPQTQEEGTETPSPEQQTSDESSTVSAKVEEPSAEDLLEDVRHSLIEEEVDQKQKESKWWRPFGKRRKTAEPEKPPEPAEIDLPLMTEPTNLIEEQAQTSEPAEQIDQMEDLIESLKAESEATAVEATIAPEVEVPAEPEPEIDIEKLKEQAFRPRTPGEEESESDVRSIALESGEEVFVEVEAPKAADPFGERLKALENTLRPYRRYLYMTLTFVGVVMAVLTSFLIFRAYQQFRPQPVKEVSNLPYPVAVSLPGGWSFNLGRGTLQAGTWEPSGPEWLEGTEVCRWVSLPWSRQLEAVLRTLNPKDPIELVMSNNDKLIYSVYSVYEMTPEEIQKQDPSSPCLLIILTGSESEKRWVLTALP